MQATIRALFENIESGGIEQGGSTITMQLVKNAILTQEQTADRKTKEIILAYRLENEMSKDEILERYLNTVYLGGGAYGVKAAAEIYWQKGVDQLGWSEAALLTALIRNPVGYDPINFPEIALERRQLVLDELAAQEVITEAEAVEFGQIPLPTERKPVLPPPEDYFVEEVKSQLLRDTRLGETYQERENAVFRGGLQIYTTINPAAQAAAEQARDTVLPDGVEPFTAAIVGVEPSSGAVRVMVGGPGFDQVQYNITTNYPGRQTGSAFKGVVLATLLEAGYVPSDAVQAGGSIPNPGGDPDPYSTGGSGGTIASVTAASSNMAYVRLGQIVGLDNVAAMAKRLGISNDFDGGDPVLTMPLGVYDVRPIEMASAFATFANGGIRHPPYLVERVEDSAGNVLFEREERGTRAMSRQSACLETQVLRGVITSGTGTRGRLDGQVAAGKTGTTTDNKDAWFVGYTPYLATAVWLGDPGDEPRDMNNVGGVRVQGGNYPTQIWASFMNAYHDALPELEFAECEKTRGGRSIRIDGTSRTSDDSSSSSRRSSGASRSNNDETPPTTSGDNGDDNGDDQSPPTEPPPDSTPEPPPPPPEPPPPPPPGPGPGGG
jgi:penicillin-binding protein 1A